MTIELENPRVDEIRQSAAHSYTAIVELVDTQIAHLPVGQLYQPPAEGEWTIMENLAHIIEIMPYWAGQIEKLIAQPGQDFGRVKTDPERIKAIADHAHDELAVVRDRLPVSYMRLESVLNGLQDSQLALTAVHSKFGQRGLDWFIKEFVTDHLANHLQQLRECLDAVKY